MEAGTFSEEEVRARAAANPAEEGHLQRDAVIHINKPSNNEDIRNLYQLLNIFKWLLNLNDCN